MKKRKTLKRVLLIILLVFVGMQFIRIDKTHPKIKKRQDFISITNPPEDIEKLIRDACYDCHSYETKYPWYAEIAPISWSIGDHIEEGREHLNFSTWGKYKQKQKDHKLHECEEELYELKMPMKSYMTWHKEARLSDDDREKLAEWFESQMKSKDSAD